MKRRNFIGSTLAAGMAGTLSASSISCTQPASTEKITGIVDCHIHFWAKDKKRFPYDKNPQYTPEQSTTHEEWENDRVGTGISMAIHVNGAPYRLNHSYLFHTLEIAPKTLRGVCLVNPNVPEGLRLFEEMVRKNNHVVGARLQTQWYWGVEWESPHLDTFWKKIGEMDKVIQLNLQAQFIWQLERLVKKYPDTRVVIDHLGLERTKSIVDYLKLLDISAYPNVYMKLSTLNRWRNPVDSQSGLYLPYENLKPLINEIVRRFTPRRLIWGSCLPRGGMGSEHYTGLLKEVLYFIDSLSPDEQRQILVKAPRRLFKL